MKRNATSELNHENWNEEEVQEERGTFTVADSNTIARRKTLPAKRRLTAENNIGGMFKGFTGISQAPKAVFNANNVNTNDDIKNKHASNVKHLNEVFLNKIQNSIESDAYCILTPLLEDYNRNLNTIKTKYPINKNDTFGSSNVISTSGSSVEATKVLFVTKPLSTEVSDNNSSEVEKSKVLFSLASSHKESSNVSQFPFGGATSNKESRSNSVAVNSNPVTFSLFNQKQESSSTEKSETSKITTTSCSKETSNSATLFSCSGNASFSFTNPKLESTKTDKIETPLFAFPNNSGSSTSLFGNVSGGIGFPVSKESKEDDEEYVPPEPEKKELKESDSIFDIRCKLYYQKNGSWIVRGVGTLFVKPFTSGKAHVVVRADNGVGNILLNAEINDKIPMTVKDENSVSIILPTDWIDQSMKPTSVVIRVKTKENAEDLCAAIKKQLQSS